MQLKNQTIILYTLQMPSNLLIFNYSLVMILGDVISGEATIAVAGLSITEERGKYVEFTAPFMQARLSIYTLKKIPKYDYSFHFLPQIEFEVKGKMLSLVKKL